MFYHDLTEVIDPPIEVLTQKSLEHELDFHVRLRLRLEERLMILGLLKKGTKVNMVKIIFETLLVVLENSILHVWNCVCLNLNWELKLNFVYK